MKRIFTLCVLLCTVLSGFAQEDSVKTKNSGDTIMVGGMVIIRSNDADTGRHRVRYRRSNDYKPRNISTNWGIVDIGFANYADNTTYGAGTSADLYAPGSNEGYFDLRDGKSINVNIWVVTQRVNLIKHYVNLKYSLGLELNNYRYKQPIRYTDNPAATPNPAVVTLDPLLNGRTYRKNKLAADYVTVPLMLNFNFMPYKRRSFGFSAGVSAGYLYSARNKTITSDEGKKKTKDDFELDRWKLSYVGEVSLGILRFYGSYALNSMYERGLDITPYTIGIRLSNW